MPSTKKRLRGTHSISVSPSEWERIRTRAAAAGMPVSRYLVMRALEPVDDPQVWPQPPPWLERIAHHVALLALIEERRVTEQAGRAVWDQLTADVDAIVAEQRMLP